ncbi:MAG: tRNA guanosine(34) transglycosylase Tgt [Thermoplasmata archaeon]
MIRFKITGEDEGARSGVIKVNGKKASTPLFMPVATRGSLRTLSNEEASDMGFRALIANAYHLLMKPGVDVIKEGGGLHKYINWPGIIFTDSGGFQMIRSGFEQDVSLEGVKFKSEVDGKIIEMMPEENIFLQKELGADVSMCLDLCPPYPAENDELVRSVEITTSWARRCKEVGHETFCISQGGTLDELRTKSCTALSEIGFQGYAVGGLSIGEPMGDMYRMLDIADRIYPYDKPRYVMGLGSPVDILESISRGMDIFDSAYPTRNARHGTVMTAGGKISIGGGRFKEDRGPLDDSCKCPVCKKYSRSYINHLFRANELSGLRLATIHNLSFMHKLMDQARTAVEEERFGSFKKKFVDDYE